MLDFVSRLHDTILELAGRLRFDRSLMRDGLIICLYGRLIELTGAILMLVNRQALAGANVIFRSFLETYSDFLNLSEDPDYAYHILAAHHAKLERILRDAAQPNEFLRLIGEQHDAGALLLEQQTALADLESRGFGPLNVFQRFERAGLQDVYRSIYRFKSSDAHGDLGALARHHIVQDGDDIRLEFYREPEAAAFEVELDSIAGLLLEATSRIHGRLGSGCEAEIGELRHELDTVRSTVWPDPG
jgi:hypothetical protein